MGSWLLEKTESQTVPVGLRLDWKIGGKLSSEILSMWDIVEWEIVGWDTV